VPEPGRPPDDVAGFGARYVSYAMRQHLDAAHHLPAGLSYLVVMEELPRFHATAHAAPGRLRGWLRVRRLRRERRNRRG
jgi:hypothetical protein